MTAPRDDEYTEQAHDRRLAALTRAQRGLLDRIAAGGAGTGSDDLAAARADIEARLAHVPRRVDCEALPANNPDVVLLTGATGFVGSFILAELLTQGAYVACLLRGGKSRRGELEARLVGLGLWQDEWRSRLRVVAGDVSRPRLSMGPADYAVLNRWVGRVIHSAARVNHLSPYSELAAVNTHSMVGILEFASTGGRKEVTLVSTGAVFDSATYPPGVEVGEEPLAALPPGSVGYSRSKALAETYLEHAADFDLAATIVRIPTIFGDRRRFQINQFDAIWSWTKAIIQTGGYPSSFDDPGNELFQGLPADVAARAVVAARAHNGDTGRRIVNAIPTAVCGTADLLAALREVGHHPRAMDDRDWYAQVSHLDSRDVWVAVTAGQLAARADTAPTRKLRRFRNDGQRGIAQLVNAHAICSPADVAGYLRSLLDSNDLARKPPRERGVVNAFACTSPSNR